VTSFQAVLEEFAGAAVSVVKSPIVVPAVKALGRYPDSGDEESLFLKWVDSCFGTVVQEAELSPGEVEKAKAEELAGWDSFGIAEWVNEEVGQRQIRKGEIFLVEYKWVFTVSEGVSGESCKGKISPERLPGRQGDFGRSTNRR